MQLFHPNWFGSSVSYFSALVNIEAPMIDDDMWHCIPDYSGQILLIYLNLGCSFSAFEWMLLGRVCESLGCSRKPQSALSCVVGVFPAMQFFCFLIGSLTVFCFYSLVNFSFMKCHWMVKSVKIKNIKCAFCHFFISSVIYWSASGVQLHWLASNSDL